LLEIVGKIQEKDFELKKQQDNKYLMLIKEYKELK